MASEKIPPLTHFLHRETLNFTEDDLHF